MTLRDRVILSLVRELRRQKATGELDENDAIFHEQIKWRNKLEYDIIKKYLRHHDEEVLK